MVLLFSYVVLLWAVCLFTAATTRNKDGNDATAIAFARASAATVTAAAAAKQKDNEPQAVETAVRTFVVILVVATTFVEVCHYYFLHCF